MSNANLPPSDPGRVYVQSTVLPLTRTAQRDLIRVLSLVLRRRLDPAPLVHALSLEYPGADAHRLDRLAKKLREGVPVIEALHATPGLFDSYVVTALRLSSDDSTLPQMFEALLKGNPGGSSVLAQNTGPSELARALFTMCVFMLMLTFLMIFIVPTFEAMFDEFGLTLPGPTRLLIAASGVFAAYWFLPALLMMMVLAIRVPAIVHSVGHRLNPLASGFLPASSPIAIRSVLGVAAQSSRPMAEKLKRVSETLDSPTMRRRIHRAAESVERGGEVWSSLAEGHILSKKEAVALAQSDSGQTQAWLLGYSAAVRQSHRTSWAHVFIRACSTSFTIFLGFIVAFIVISLFLPLVELISGLS